MISEVVSTGARHIELDQNHYITSDDIYLYYRHGATQGACEAAEWNFYTGAFLSLGYVQIKIQATDFPLAVDSGGRVLKGVSGNAILLLSDSPQGMLVSISTSDMESYFSIRAGQGFNCTQVHVIAGPSFGGGTNFETYDGIHPFTVDGDLSTPNNNYFSRLDALVTLAAKYGMVVMLNAANVYPQDGTDTVWASNGNTKCYNFGAYLGNRYKDNPNIIWCYGNDFQDWDSDTNTVNAVLNVMQGIKSADSNHTLHSAWLDYPGPSASRDCAALAAETTLDFGYSYYVGYDVIAIERALNPAMPVFLGETEYEGGSYYWSAGLPLYIRKQNYGGMLAGACGVTYMNTYWNFGAGWDSNMDLQGALEIAYLKKLFEGYAWYDLVPDAGHVTLTNGYATWASGVTLPENNDFAYAGRVADGSLVIIYMSANRTMTIDCTKLAGTFTARWFDPTNGQYYTDAASPLANTGTHDFSRSGANSVGDHDWVLVLST